MTAKINKTNSNQCDIMMFVTVPCMLCIMYIVVHSITTTCQHVKFTAQMANDVNHPSISCEILGSQISKM